MPFLTIFILLSFATPVFGETGEGGSPSQVWTVGDRRWTAEEESLYGHWVETHLTEDFLLRHKIPVDCADVPYAIRWIYARIAKLPAAATTRDGDLIGHWSTQWKHLPTHSEWHRDLRFRESLLHMLSRTTTRTLPLDTYPIRITPDAVTPGTVFFVTESHSGIVGQIVADGSHAHPLQTWEATVPAKLQKMNRRSFLSPRPESTIYSGLVKFRWPIFEGGKWTYLPRREHPFYSEEQYSSGFYEGTADFAEAVAKRIDPTVYPPAERANRIVESITQYLRERIPIVLAGYETCRKGNCPEGSNLWEVHSTPGRDGTITLLMDHLHRIIEANHLEEGPWKEKMEGIEFHISKDRTVSFRHVYENYLWLSPHPGDSIEARWGLKKCEMLSSRIRSARASISFIERTYRKRDPQYAAFAIRQQQEMLRRLQEEWERSRCRETPSPAKKKGKR